MRSVRNAALVATSMLSLLICNNGIPTTTLARHLAILFLVIATTAGDANAESKYLATSLRIEKLWRMELREHFLPMDHHVLNARYHCGLRSHYNASTAGPTGTDSAKLDG